MIRVFVFGTLKQGFPNFKFNQGRRVQGDFLTLEKYPLYLVGERYVPWLMLNAEGGYQVRGEVYEVSDEALAVMDALEQVNEPDGYSRVELPVYCEDTQKTSNAHVYCKTIDQLDGADLREKLQGSYTLEHAELYSGRRS